MKDFLITIVIFLVLIILVVLGKRYVLINKIQTANYRQQELIYSVEDKLHSILNQRAPTTDTTDKKESNLSSDFTQSMDMQINLVQISNDRLENILSHLRKIV